MVIVQNILRSMFFKVIANFSMGVFLYKKTPFYVLVTCRPVFVTGNLTCGLRNGLITLDGTGNLALSNCPLQPLSYSCAS